jgi:hypothetical protein
MRMKAFAAAALTVSMLQPALAQISKGKDMRIRMTIGTSTIEASLYDNATARDFAAMLPLTVPLEDYAATEKIAYLPHKLSTAGAPKGSTPSAGDIGYYAPWGNLALYHKGFDYSPGLVLLGRIDKGIEVLKVPGKRSATVEAISSK